MADFDTTADTLAKVLAEQPDAREALHKAISGAVAVVNQYAPGASPLGNAQLGDFLVALRVQLDKLRLEGSTEISGSIFGDDGGDQPPPVGSIFGTDGPDKQ